MKAIIACSLLLVSSLITGVGVASEAVSFRTTQANVQLPLITTWLDIADDKGQKITALKPEQLSATVGPYSAQVKSLQPFAETQEGTAFVFMVDISKSIKAQDFKQLQAALTAWVEGLHEQDVPR